MLQNKVLAYLTSSLGSSSSTLPFRFFPSSSFSGGGFKGEIPGPRWIARSKVSFCLIFDFWFFHLFKPSPFSEFKLLRNRNQSKLAVQLHIAIGKPIHSTCPFFERSVPCIWIITQNGVRGSLSIIAHFCWEKAMVFFVLFVIEPFDPPKWHTTALLQKGDIGITKYQAMHYLGVCFSLLNNYNLYHSHLPGKKKRIRRTRKLLSRCGIIDIIATFSVISSDYSIRAFFRLDLWFLMKKMCTFFEAVSDCRCWFVLSIVITGQPA